MREGAPEEAGARLEGTGLRIALVVARFNAEITEELLGGARACLLEQGVAEADLTVHRVPGAWELPQAVGKLLDGGGWDAVVALGCVIRGETPHFEFVAGETARGLTRVALRAGIPVSFGVLTTDTEAQARERAGTDGGNKGREAALAALEMAALFRRLG